MILLENIDGKIWNLESKIIDMILEYQEIGNLTINLNGEGPCCENLEIYHILDHMCKKFNMDKKKITIITANKIEKHDQYNIVIGPGDDIQKTAIALRDVDTKVSEDNIKHTGLLIGRSNSFRLWLSGWIWKNYRDKTVMSFHFDPTNEFHLAHIGLDGMLKWQATLDELQDATDLIARCPLTLDSPGSYPILPPENLNVIKEYKNFFLDIVMETYFSNNTFFMTEKIVRPLMAMTPFIVFAAPGFLRNMREMGYKTFDRWWSEEYDNYGEQLRIYKIQEILKGIYAKSIVELKLMLDEMQPILNHNRELTIRYAEQGR